MKINAMLVAAGTFGHNNQFSRFVPKRERDQQWGLSCVLLTHLQVYKIHPFYP